ncbi:MAG: Type II/IV secretion system secretin RcpA/CpaC, associated with Flp pilus assembly [uncultured Sphingosinicella sp.]|uniref:Type II/IV secretion system secretin RcpA/CpaC, associated with Flp pilus assembly n=1 Tax=uncultured Sphingosinicella sp. TaxID=478748 RepID=A0A6J4TGG0_9SPHN|nr:type II and III secretion system protein family protein [uncultured Sphingosinicella sp.]CAA9522711.1 MAG: Type II/IV secretion system secretin RcpA/CpaC, associated with Flp pilus assembly [uncultured Sphingosinicella sp.]
MITNRTLSQRLTLGTAMAALIAASLGAAAPAPALAQPVGASKPTTDVALSAGTGRLVQLNGAMSDLFVANDGIADVQVRSSNQIYIFGKSAGETTVYATNKAGRVLYSANVRVGTNIGSIDEMLALAMPDARIQATPMNGMVLLTGTVATPQDVEEANRLVQAFVGNGSQVISRVKTATPLQVMLKVKIAEVNRTLLRNVGFNLLANDAGGSGFLFGLGRGNPGTIKPILSDTYIDPLTGNPLRVGTEYTFNRNVNSTVLSGAGRLLGVDVLAALDLNENSGLVTTLAEPTLTALSGETASFLAGGEFPIPTAQGINGTSIEFKQYGVSLAFTPVVLEGGRISMRVRPEVSEISPGTGVRLNGFDIPGLTTRRTETTVELGSGQSFMIGGLLRHNNSNSVEKAPFLGDIPILGALFRSNGFRKDETELVIVVTPYLVKPVSASQIALPTDGYRQSNDTQRILLDQREDSRSGERRPGPVVAPPAVIAPGVGGVGSAALPAPLVPAPAPASAPVKQAAIPARSASVSKTSAAPGFSF